MRRLALAVALSVLVPAAALAQGSSAPPEGKGKSGAAASDPMAGWTPPKVTREAQGRKELTAFMKKMEDAGKKGDLEAAAALIDFPVMMITDAKSGEAGGEPWTAEQWKQAMTPFYEKPMEMKITHKPTIVFLTDSLASITDQWTMSTGAGKSAKKLSGRSAMLAIRKGGEWKAKAMMEGGWGDMAMEGQGGAAGGGTGSTGSMGGTGETTATEATDSSDREPAAGGTGATGTGAGAAKTDTGPAAEEPSGAETGGTGPQGLGTPGTEPGTTSTDTGGTETGGTSPEGTGTTGSTGATGGADAGSGAEPKPGEAR